MKKVVLVVVGLIVAFSAFAYLNNAAWLSTPVDSKPLLLAHRGLAQTFPPEGIEADTCTATRIRPPAHRFLENTLASMRAAFDAGADIVELDVHPTTDGQFAVFHDWTLDCRTDGKGNTRDHSLAELKALDVGYGYTTDGGKSFPFRGTGIGAMPTLDEVLAAFPERRFLVHIKSNIATDGKKLAERLDRLPPGQRERIWAYGGDRPVNALGQRIPVKTMTAPGLKRCILHYIAIGWSGTVPESCRNTVILVPVNIGPWLWGWPHRFVERMRQAGSEVFVLGPWGGGDFSQGIDTETEVGALPAGYAGGIWTNRVDVIAPLVQRRGS